MIYLSQLLGNPVLDADGEKIGTVSDLGIATGEVFPRVTSLAFMGPGRTPIMISWRKYVERYDENEVNLKVIATDLRFSYLQPDEVLLARDILNKQIVDTHGMRVVRVNDLKLSDTSSTQLRLLGAEVGARDNAQLIFESLNSKGMPLTTADLIRNLLLVNAGYDEQTRLYNLYWAPIERLYADDPDSQRLNAALHGYLAVTARKLRISDKDQVYGAFKTFMEDVYQGPLEELLIGLKGFCETFAAKSNSAGARRAQAAAEFGNSKPKDYIGQRHVFGD